MFALVRRPAASDRAFHKALRFFSLALVCALGLAVSSGCIFSPRKDDKPPVEPPPEYLPNSSPENVLLNLISAWQARDSTVIVELYDPAYEGTSDDLTDQDPDILTFTWVNERETVGKLRSTPTISNVLLDFGAQSSWEVLSSDDPAHPEWAVIALTGVRISITDGLTTYEVNSGSDVITFKFQPYPDPSLPLGTRWRIVRWVEIRSTA